MAQVASINLVRATQTRFWDRLLKWAISTGRFLIILTETIALSAFVYRFTLDRQIVDLADSIKEKQAIIALYGDAEVRYRNLQERLAFVKEVAASEDPKTVLLKQLVTLAQGQVAFQSLAISDSGINLEVIAPSSAGLSEFLRGLKTLPEVRSVAIDRVENKAESGVIVVTIRAELLNSGGGEE